MFVRSREDNNPSFPFILLRSNVNTCLSGFDVASIRLLSSSSSAYRVHWCFYNFNMLYISWTVRVVLNLSSWISCFDVKPRMHGYIVTPFFTTDLFPLENITAVWYERWVSLPLLSANIRNKPRAHTLAQTLKKILHDLLEYLWFRVSHGFPSRQKMLHIIERLTSSLQIIFKIFLLLHHADLSCTQEPFLQSVLMIY